MGCNEDDHYNQLNISAIRNREKQSLCFIICRYAKITFAPLQMSPVTYVPVLNFHLKLIYYICNNYL